MNTTVPIHRDPRLRGLNRRTGVTLLEVLVACGILVIGLASVASILPAAGVRLGQATLEDRAGAAAANAYADLVNRGLISAEIFGSGTMRSAVFGQMLPALSLPPMTSGTYVVDSSTAAPNVLQTRFDANRACALEDDLVYKPSALGDTPVSSYFNGVAPREYRSGVCWGALLAPESFPAVSGGVATLSIAVFRKPGDVKEVSLVAASPGSAMFQYTSGNPAEDDSIRKAYLPGCGYVLALPTSGAMTPKWIRITSSWTTNGSVYVVLDLFPLGSNLGGLIASGTTMTAIAFENLLRVDQYPVSLE